MTRSSPVNERHLNFGPFESDIERTSGSHIGFYRSHLTYRFYVCVRVLIPDQPLK